MSTDNLSKDGMDGSNLPPPNPLNRPDLKRTLKDLLVQDEVSDSDVEMFEKYAVDDEKFDQNEDSIDPEMCVECGDQVSYPPPETFESESFHCVDIYVFV